MNLRSSLLFILLALNGLVLLSPTVSLAGICATLLFMIPGTALGLRTDSGQTCLAERLALAVASGLVGALFFAAVLGPLSTPMPPGCLLVILNLCAALAILRLRKPAGPDIQRTGQGITLLVLLVVSLGMRLTHLGSSEFQGDEARAMFLASGFAAGDHGILFLHRKGPAEALLAAPPLLITGQVTEAAARFPFALAGGILPLFAFALVRRWSGAAPGAALAAAALVSCDGFLFAFSRIVQYQTPLVLFVTAAFLRVAAIGSKGHSLKAAIVYGGLFFAAAALCHYDALFCLPAFAIYVVGLLRERGVSLWEAIVSALPAIFCGTALLAAFYLPFFLHSQFSSTAGYLAQRLGMQKLPIHNLARYLALLTFYGGGFSAVVGYGGALLGVLWWSWNATSRGGIILVWIGTLLLVATTVICQTPTHSKLLSMLGALGLLLAVLPLATSANTPLAQRVLLIWVWVPLGVLGFFFARPNTHFYILHLPLAIIAGSALATMFKERSSLERFVVGVGGVLAFCVSLAYLNTAYLTPTVEYRFAAPRAIPWFSRPFFAGGISPGPFFGFQRRSGWKAVACLYSHGKLADSYGSNEEELVTSWYLWPTVREQATPRNFYIAARPNDPSPISPSKIAQRYHFWGRVYVDGRRGLEIMRADPPIAPPQPFQLEAFIKEFDSRVALFKDARAALAQAPSR